MKKQQSGFTLVEIAIVMVIIGLLLGGVLKGQEVITNARLKNITNDYNGVSAAIYSYQDRYRATPGDDFSAEAHVGTTGINGNGNGQIVGAFNSVNNGNESRMAWLHLRAAGLVAGPADFNDPASFIQPSNAFGGVTGIESDARTIRGLVVGFSDIPGDIAIILESQNDDGITDTGSIQSVNGAAGAYLRTGNYNLVYGL